MSKVRARPGLDEGCVVGSRSKRRVFAQDDYDDGELGGAMPGGSLGTHSFALTTSLPPAQTLLSLWLWDTKLGSPADV